MRKLITILSIVGLVACAGKTLTAPPAQVQKPRADISCQSGYIIAYDENGNPYCTPAPKQTVQKDTTAVTHTAVVVTTQSLIPFDLTRWLHADERFYHDNVAANQPVTCNGRDVNGVMLVAITRNDGSYIDQGTSCLHVGANVVARWLFVDDSIGKANPTWSQKMIQDTIATGRF